MEDETKKMNEIIDDLLNKYENKYAITHPILSKLWREYMINKKKSIQNDIKMYKNIFQNLKDTDDITLNDLLIMYIIK